MRKKVQNFIFKVEIKKNDFEKIKKKLTKHT